MLWAVLVLPPVDFTQDVCLVLNDIAGGVIGRYLAL